MDSATCAPHSYHQININPTNYFLSLGTILFAYGGHSGFPTTQHDMKKPEDFTKSSILAFIVLTLLYLPVCLFGYFVYGNSLRDSVTSSIQHVWIQQLANFLITGHAIFSVIIVLNPINQTAEKFCKVPPKFGIQRVLVRAAVLGLAIFVAESVPTFGPLLDLSGGSTQSSMSLIFPPICYLFLNAAEKKMEMRRAWLNKADKKIEMHFESFKQRATISDVFNYTDVKMLFVCTFISAFGLLGGLAATFSAIRALTFTHFVPPCYISAFTSSIKEEVTNMGTINCCGAYQNISIYGKPENYCSEADLHFYS
uniref:Amino acid transporter transmembrane domain-containing protein n=1 Tax=Globodera rostochiensis TaxID=31243 RepID=A0A914H4Z1_GLORO